MRLDVSLIVYVVSLEHIYIYVYLRMKPRVTDTPLVIYLSIYIYIYIYIYILQQCMVVTISLGRFVADQMRYNLESAQYL